MWFNTYLYTRQKNLTTLQYELQRLIAVSKNLRIGAKIAPTKVIETAMGVIFTIPMVAIYTVFHKYLVFALIVGREKG